MNRALPLTVNFWLWVSVWLVGSGVVDVLLFGDFDRMGMKVAQATSALLFALSIWLYDHLEWRS